MAPMKKKVLPVLLAASLFSPLASCRTYVSGRINFDLNGGAFTDENFQTTYIEGKAGTPILVSIPTPVKEGYYFVGWREKDSSGAYRVINKRLYSDGQSYFYYPYGTDTFYAYFEPLITLTFHLGDGNENASFVAPELDSSSFSGNVLSGYATKGIPNTKYLPTAEDSKDHLNFDYWYSEYPLVSSTDKNNVTHYSLNTDVEPGQFRFDESFGSDGMSFPMDSNIDLFAHWTSDPTITVHFGMEGFSSTSFKASTSIEEELKNLMKENFGIDYSVASKVYTYLNESENIRYRFSGFYLDPEFTSPFYLDSPILDQDIDLYLKWDEQVTLILDYNGGTLNGETSHTISNTYFEGDTLGEDVLTSYTPTKVNANFLSYTYNGKTFSFLNDKLPGGEVTLVASYHEWSSLTITYDYPSDYTGTKKEDIVRKINAGESITTYITNAETAVADDSLVFVEAKLVRDDGTGEPNPYSTMPDKDIKVALVYDYKGEVSITSYDNSTGSYVASSLDPITVTFDYSTDSSGKLVPTPLTLSSITGLEKSLTIGSNTYLYDGLYTDTDLTKEAVFPLFGTTSHDSQKVLPLYRKLTKGITLTFYNYDDKDRETKTSLGTLLVLPSHQVSLYQSDLNTLLNVNNKTYQTLYIKEGDNYRKLSTLLPSVDSEVYVSFRN